MNWTETKRNELVELGEKPQLMTTGKLQVACEMLMVMVLATLNGCPNWLTASITLLTIKCRQWKETFTEQMGFPLQRTGPLCKLVL